MYLETLDAAFAIDTGPRRAAAALLHGDPGVASGGILLIISATMVLGQHDQNGGSRPAEDQDPTQVAVQLVLNGTGSVAGSGAAARVDGWPRGDRTDAGRGMTGVGDWPGIC